MGNFAVLNDLRQYIAEWSRSSSPGSFPGGRGCKSRLRHKGKKESFRTSPGRADRLPPPRLYGRCAPGYFLRAMKEVIISTEAVNCYGYRVLTSGIDTSQYEKNPVLLWMHRRSFEPGAMPIGRIENLRVEEEQLIGTPVFEGEDAFAKQIESKWENGFLRMASAAFEIQETSDAPELLTIGQTRETVTRCKLIEVSIVDIGGNDEALQLYQDGKLLQLAKATPELRRERTANRRQKPPITKPIKRT